MCMGLLQQGGVQGRDGAGCANGVGCWIKWPGSLGEELRVEAMAFQRFAAALKGC